jgi:WD40 repeat protein
LIRSVAGHSATPFGLAISPDGKMLASAGRGQILLWDTATGGLVAELPGHRQWIFGLSFSPDAKTLASGSADGTIKLWSLSIRQEVCTIPFIDRPTADDDPRVAELSFAPDGNSLWALGWSGELKVWRVPSWDEIARAENTTPGSRAK